MNHTEFKQILAANDEVAIHIMLPSGEFVPDHFHVTEVGRVTKVYIDCGGTCREHKSCSMQVWTSHDTDHRLKSNKLLKIIDMAKPLLGVDDLPLEIEYGEDVAATYFLSEVESTPHGLLLILKGKQTDCLAPDKCGVKQCCKGDTCQTN